MVMLMMYGEVDGWRRKTTTDGYKGNGSPASGPLLIFPAPTPFSLHNSEGLVAGADHASRSNSEGNKAE